MSAPGAAVALAPGATHGARPSAAPACSWSSSPALHGPDAPRPAAHARGELQDGAHQDGASSSCKKVQAVNGGQVEVGIDGFSWLNDLSIINNQSSRDLSESWIGLFPLNRLNINTYSSSARLLAILRSFSYLKISSDKEILNKVNKIIKNDYCFLNLYKNFSFNILERLTICHCLILSGYAFNFNQSC